MGITGKCLAGVLCRAVLWYGCLLVGNGSGSGQWAIRWVREVGR